MSAITPDSFVKLVRFDVTKENQITFPDGVAQVNYFLNAEGIEASDFTYVRQEGKIRFPYVIDSIEKYNYVVVQNTPYNYKYYFYYITDMKYVNDEMTDVFIKLDVFQTYQFDFIYKKSFVEREHVNDDTIGKHTIPESLEMGEYVVNSYDRYEGFNRYCAFITATKPYDIASEEIACSSVYVNGVPFSTFIYIAFSPTDIMHLLEFFTENPIAGAESITSIYFIPRNLINEDSYYTTMYKGYNVYVYEGEIAPFIFNHNESKPTALNGYTPKNKKLLTYPYCFMVASNNSGSSNIYQYEKWKSANCQFDISCVATCGCSIKLVPREYTENHGYDEEEGIMCGKFPISNWVTQGYETWLSQNALNLNGQVATGILATAYGFSSKDIGTGVSGILQIADVMKQVYQHNMTPNSANGNVNGGDLNFAQENLTFFFYKKSIRAEMAKVIDDYFSMFGYKVNALKIPNITGRQNWNYVKTINANVEGNNIPEKYLNEYKEMLNNGMTFWQNPATFLDYSQNNPII